MSREIRTAYSWYTGDDWRALDRYSPFSPEKKNRYEEFEALVERVIDVVKGRDCLGALAALETASKEIVRRIEESTFNG